MNARLIQEPFAFALAWDGRALVARWPVDSYSVACRAKVANGPCLDLGKCRYVLCDPSVLAVCSREAARPAGACRCASASPDLLADPCVARLAHLYVCEGLSTYRIGQVTGLDRQRVTRLLRRAGVTLRPRGGGGTRPARRTGDPPELARLLARLYVDRRLTIAQIGAVLGIPARTIHDRLRRYGIRSRTRGGCDREDRLVLPADLLWDLYHHEGLSADDVGRKLDTNRNAVLRTAHALGLPVRVGGAAQQSGPDEIELVSALYADELVSAVLAAHNVPHVPAGGPIWQRFPVPVPLTRALVEDLYWRCGAGLNHIELLTGQPAQTVRGFMRRTGIATRHPGGRTPFLRRWRTGSSGDENPSPEGSRPGPRIRRMRVARPWQSKEDRNNTKVEDQ